MGNISKKKHIFIILICCIILVLCVTGAALLLYYTERIPSFNSAVDDNYPRARTLYGRKIVGIRYK